MATCDDYLVQCPYDRSHMIRRSRIQQHIVKCERNFPGLVMEWCPHNASHRFARHEDYIAHVPNCPDARINSNVLIMMAMKYHETGDVSKVNYDPDMQVGSGENWSLEYDDSSGCENVEVGDRRQDISDGSSGRGSCESEESDVDDVTNEMTGLGINGEISILDQIQPYSWHNSTDFPVRKCEETHLPTLKKTCSPVENHYLRGISIGRGHKLPWLYGKPGKATYQKIVEQQETECEAVEMSVGRGFTPRSHIARQQVHWLRKPASSCNW